MRAQALEAEGAGRSYVNMLWLLLRLRQACNHPWLLKSPHKPSGTKIPAAQLAAAQKLDPVVRRLECLAKDL